MGKQSLLYEVLKIIMNQSESIDYIVDLLSGF